MLELCCARAFHTNVKNGRLTVTRRMRYSLRDAGIGELFPNNRIPPIDDFGVNESAFADCRIGDLVDDASQALQATPLALLRHGGILGENVAVVMWNRSSAVVILIDRTPSEPFCISQPNS